MMSLEEIFARKGIITMSRVLASNFGQNLSVRQLALHSGISPSEASIVVKKMRDLGIIQLNRSGKAFIVSLNRDNYIWQRILKPILEAEAEMQKENVKTISSGTRYLLVDTLSNYISKRLQREGDKIISAILYGNLKSNSLTNIFLYIRFKDDYPLKSLIKTFFSEMESRFNLKLDGPTGTPYAFWDDFHIKSKQIRNITYDVLIGADPKEWLRQNIHLSKGDPS